MKANETLHEMSLQEEGNLPRSHWQEARTAVSPHEGGGVRRRHGAAHLPNPRRRQGQVLPDLYPSADTPAIDDTLFALHEHKEFKVRDYLVIRYFPQSREILVDWIAP